MAKSLKRILLEDWKKEKIIRDEKVFNAFKSVKRENFVLPEYKNLAYLDEPLPIGAGQTISQPTTVAIMTSALEPKAGQKILEIGTGSGYQAAILAHIVGQKGKVVSVERIKELVDFAKKNLKKEGIKNVTVIHGDGSKGYAPEAPYDRIIVTACAPKIPEKLIDQLKIGGILVCPVGKSYFAQKMLKIKKLKDRLDIEDLGYFAFVPLIEEHG